MVVFAVQWWFVAASAGINWTQQLEKQSFQGSNVTRESEFLGGSLRAA